MFAHHSRIWSMSAGLLGAAALGCNGLTEASQPTLIEVVERDGIAFDFGSIPSTLVDQLAEHRLVIVGETHFLREHRELVVELLEELHARGFRQLLLEWPQMADCLVNDFLAGGAIWPDWEPPEGVMAEMIGPIREFNRTLPDGDGIRVRGIDVNLDEYGGVQAFLDLLETVSAHLAYPPSLEALLTGRYQDAGTHQTKLAALRNELDLARSDLMSSWGSYWYETISEMVDVEVASLEIRAYRNADYDRSVRLRENEMKRLSDLRLAGQEHGTVVNVGGNHAQKSYLKGTSQEWLGDYLVHHSDAAGGSAIAVAVTAASIVTESGSEYQLEGSPKNEIFRLMHETWPDQVVYMPLDDPLFSGSGVPMNFEDEIYVDSPKKYYDAFVLLPTAERTLPRFPIWAGGPGG